MTAWAQAIASVQAIAEVERAEELGGTRLGSAVRERMAVVLTIVRPHLKYVSYEVQVDDDGTAALVADAEGCVRRVEIEVEPQSSAIVVRRVDLNGLRDRRNESRPDTLIDDFLWLRG